MTLADLGPLRFVGVDEDGRHVARAPQGACGPVVQWQIIAQVTAEGGYFVTVPIPKDVRMYPAAIENGLLTLEYVVANKVEVF